MRGQRTRHVRPSELSVSPAHLFGGAGLVLAGVASLLFATQPAYAIGTAVGLGTADAYAVLGGQTVTNTGPTVVTGDLGVSPGTAVTGFPPGIVLGAIHAADAQALQAQTDVTTAYNNAAGQAPDASIAGDLGGLTLVAGVYNASSSIGLTGTLTLDAQGDPNAVFIFQVGSTLTTASASAVSLINGARSCNVFWQVGSSATLGTATTFVGNILALASISATTGATIDGRALARNGAVTLDTNTVTRSTCAIEPTTPPTDTPTTPPTDTPTTPPTDTPTTPVDIPTTGLTGAPSAPAAEGPTPPTTDSSTSSGGPGTVTGNGDRWSPPGTNLALTGISSRSPLIAAAVFALILGTGLLVVGMRRRYRGIRP